VTFDDSLDPPALARRHLAASERPTFEARAPRGRVPWLLGRIAAKEAVRRHLVDRGFAEIDPTRIVVGNDAHGCPVVRIRGAHVATRGVRVSIAHKPTIAVAVAATLRSPAPGAGLGIDIEAVESRSPTFERTVLTPAERSLAANADDARDTWLTRLWAVKEAAAKATGLGLGGRPKDFEIDAVRGDRLHCRDRWIATETLQTVGGAFIVAWTDTY
jgi:phosphopantetheinyl transferase (holo-ACP synthase)